MKNLSDKQSAEVPVITGSLAMYRGCPGTFVLKGGVMERNLQVAKKHLSDIRDMVNLQKEKIEYLLRDIPAKNENDNDTVVLLIEDVLKSHNQTIDEIYEKIKAESNGRNKD